MADANLNYGDSYTFQSGGKSLGNDIGRDWAVLWSAGLAVQIEGAASTGDVLTGYDVYIHESSNEGVPRYLVKTPEGWLRWALTAAIDDRAQFQIYNNADNSQQGVPIPASGPFSLYVDGQWVGQESGKDYLELSSTAISFSATQLS
ncbi:MAG TPA: hypothetical protein VGF69_20275 [Thermoanaerobaculia bacterium]